ncbi:MAG: hypothetical protein JWQ30_2165 [Sediminibacterium sp.]|nr:hypothetical protein [Sediminibacterium sp.]
MRASLCETLCSLCLCGKAFASLKIPAIPVCFFHHRDTGNTEFHREFSIAQHVVD